MTHKRIIALDPGRTTGLAYLMDNVPYGEQVGPELHHEELYRYLMAYKPDIVVCERFVYQRRLNVDLIPCEYIGVTKLYCAAWKIPYHEQGPSEAKAFWDDPSLKRCGLYQPGQPHRNDAMRHLLYFITFNLKDEHWLHRGK